ncbi:unnamed protein product [Dovyalis caffra]|uniref:Uncharacterized protein n=1 Tax=Dovyalis caffra TaxID=77055 RepID=A0AAV1R238_9ROSI|nr:unnamed protein product [Dovyalis caffra]
MKVKSQTKSINILTLNEDERTGGGWNLLRIFALSSFDRVKIMKEEGKGRSVYDFVREEERGVCDCGRRRWGCGCGWPMEDEHGER